MRAILARSEATGDAAMEMAATNGRDREQHIGNGSQPAAAAGATG